MFSQVSLYLANVRQTCQESDNIKQGFFLCFGLFLLNDRKPLGLQTTN